MTMQKTNRMMQVFPKVCPWPLEPSFRDAWSQLFSARNCPLVFCRLEWLETCFEVYSEENGQPLPMRFEDEKGNLVAMALLQRVMEPGRFSRRVVIRTVDNNVQRHLPLLAQTIDNMAAAVLSLVKNYGKEVDDFDFFKLDGMHGDLEELQKTLSSQGYAAQVSTFNEQPVFLLEGTWETYLEQRTQGHRKKIRRYTRKLQEAYPDYAFTRLRTPEDFASYGIDALFSEIMGLYDLGWQAEELNEKTSQGCGKLKHFYESVGRKFIPMGLLDVCLLKVGGQLIAFELNLCDERSVHMMMGSYHPDFAEWSPGSAVLSEILQDSYARGYQRIEFGGDYLEYKKLWTKTSEFSHWLRIPGKTLRSRVKQMLRSVKHQVLRSNS